MTATKEDLLSDLLAVVSYHYGSEEMADEISGVINSYFHNDAITKTQAKDFLIKTHQALSKMPFYNAKDVMDNVLKLAKSVDA